MKLTGKCKEAFEKYVFSLNHHGKLLGDEISSLSIYTHLNILGIFRSLPDSAKFGVYVDFFLTPPNGILMDYSLYDRRVRVVDFIQDVEEKVYVFDTTYEFECKSDLENKSKHESFAIEKANEILNERL